MTTQNTKVDEWEKKFEGVEKKRIENEFMEVVEGFLKFTSTKYNEIFFGWLPSSQPFQIMLCYHPFLMPIANTVLCILKQNGKTLECLTGNKVDDTNEIYKAKDPGSLFTYLESLASSNYFESQMSLMTEINTKPSYDGFIHTNQLHMITKDDLKISILREEVMKMRPAFSKGLRGNTVNSINRIRGASKEFQIKAVVQRNDYPETGFFLPENKDKYNLLEVNGFVSKVKSINANGNNLTIDAESIVVVYG